MKYLILIIFLICTFPVSAQDSDSFAISPVALDHVRPARYARSFLDPAGDIHVMGLFRVSLQEDGQLITRVLDKPLFSSTALNEAVMNTFYSRPGFFIALNNVLHHEKGSTYFTKMWRSDDDLKTIRETESRFIIPEAGKVEFGKQGEWAGLFCHRSVIQLADGSLLAAMYGNFESDTIRPTNPQSRSETRYKLRAFVVRSVDRGLTWNYLSSVAVPIHGGEDRSEGYNEWSMIQLDDGRILAVIRTGHFSPMILSYSADQGHSWSPPAIHPDLGPAGCDPYLLKLEDGRIALAYGEMVQPSVYDDQYFNVLLEKGDRRRRCRLAVSLTPLADHWQTCNITGYGNRSAYPTIFQVQPGVILYQSDLEIYRIQIPQ